MVVYKCIYKLVGKLIEVNPKDTSKNCSNPNCNNKGNKDLLERIHKCKECDLEIDRDLNAPINIVNKVIDLIGQVLPKFKSSDIKTSGEFISLSWVVEQGSPTFNETAKAIK